MQSIHEGIIPLYAVHAAFFTPIIDAPPAACGAVCLYVLDCDLLVQDMAASSSAFVLLSFCPSEDATVKITPPLSCFCFLCVLSLVHLSFNLYVSPFFSSPTHSLPLHLSCRLFIRCVNNCLPTVIIALPCQLEV